MGLHPAPALGGGPIPTGSAFRFDSTRLGQATTQLNRAAAGLDSFDMLVIADSIGEGTAATSLATRWQGICLADLRAAKQPAGVVGGVGYLPAQFASSTMTQLFAFTGTADTNAPTTYFGLAARYRRMTSGATATLPFTGTGLDLYFAQGASAHGGTYAIDGETPIVFDTNDPVTLQSGFKIARRGLTAGAHTLVVTATASFVYLEGVVVYNGDESVGVRMWDSGHSAWRTLDFVEPGGLGPFSPYRPYRLIQPDLVYIGLGTNDFGHSSQGSRIYPADYQRYLRNVIAAVRSQCTVEPSFIVEEPATRGDSPALTGSLVAPWPEYVEAIRREAQRDGRITLLSMDPIMGDESNAANPLMNADKLHPNTAGHAARGHAVASLILGA